MNVQTDHH